MATISEVSSQYIDDVAELDPERGERWGIATDPTRLTDYSPVGIAAQRALLARTIDALSAADAPRDEAERLGAGFLADALQGELRLTDLGERQREVSAIVGPPANTRAVFDLMDRSTPEAWRTIAARLRAVPGCLDGYREALEAGLADGHPAARRQAIAVAEQCTTWAGDGDGGWFAGFVAGAASVDADARLQDELRLAAAQAGGAYGRLASWLRDEYAPRAAETDAAGEVRYRAWASYLLGTELDLDEAYGWAWEELARLEKEKATECARILPGATFLEVRELLLTDPARSIEGVDAYRDWLQATTDEAIEGLDGREFEIDQRIRRCDVRIPPEGSVAAAYYTPPSEDLARPGQTWFPTMGRARFPTWDEVSTVYHEAVPGHHLQGATIRIVPLTRAHRLGFLSAHGEGWALYAERLMDELGWFRTPDTRLGFLCAHAFRAARVVVDIGLHTGRAIPLAGTALYPDWAAEAGGPWTYDGAIDFMVRAGGLERASAESEVQRYLSWPSQATAYKLGERTWLAGRAAAQAAAAAEGRAFDLKGWHARALALGPLGLDRLGGELARA